MSNYTYLVSPDFEPSLVPEGYIWDETAFQELVKATDKATADQTIYTYGGAQGDINTVYDNAADLTISNQKYDSEEVVETIITANAFNNTGTVTTDGATVFSVQSFSNSGTFNLDKSASMAAAGAITNTVDGTINLNADSTLEGSTIGNAGTISVVSDHAAINGAISNNGTIDAMMKKLTVTGDIQNANEHDTMEARDNSVITSREFEVTGNVLNYGVIGVEYHPIHEMTVSGELNNYRQVMADVLTAGSIHSDGIYTGVEERRTRGYIVAGEVNAGSIDIVSGIIMTSVAKETAAGVNVTGTINNGNADNYLSTINAGLNGWIKAASLNNIGTDAENSLIDAGKITIGDIMNNGGISTRIVESAGTITNNATGLFFVSFIDDPIVTGLVEAASITAGTIINDGTFTVCSEADLPTPVTVTSIENNGTFKFSGAGFTLTGDIVNNAKGQIDVAGTMTSSTAAITNSGTISISNTDDVSGALNVNTITNTATGTIKLNAGSTLEGATVANAGTITVVSDYAAINGKITNNGIINAMMRKLIISGDIQNANEHDTMEARDNSVITAREFEVTGNVSNYGVIGVEYHPIHEMTVSGELNNYRQVMADVLTAGSIHSDGIYTGVEERRTRGYIVAGEVNAGSIDIVSGIIMTSVAKETAAGVNVTGTINNGNADNYLSTINAGLNGWIKAASLNNIGTDAENSLIDAGKITVGDIMNNGGISTRIVESAGTITNNATGLFFVSFIDDPIVTGLVEAASITAGTIINDGTFTVCSEANLPTAVTVESIENNGTFEFSGAGFTLTGDIVNNANAQISIAGTVTGTGSITNSGTIRISNTNDISGFLTSGAISGGGTIQISASAAAKPTDPVALTADVSNSIINLEVSLGDLTANSYQFVSGTIGSDVTFQVNGTVYEEGVVIGDTNYVLTTNGSTGLWMASKINGPDDGWNDYVYDKNKIPQWSDAYTNGTFVNNPLDKAGTEIFLDEIGTINVNNYHNYVGRKTFDDAADFGKITLDTAASLKFTVNSMIAGSFALYQVVDGNLKTVKLDGASSQAVKADDAAKSTMKKAVLLEKGDYYFGMTANKFAKDAEEIDGFYNAYLTDDSKFFNLADNGWNDSAYVIDSEGKIDKTKLNPDLVDQEITLKRGMDEVVLDNNVTGDYSNWVGFSDEADYKMFHLDSAANLRLSLQATDKAKLTLWAVSMKGDKYTLSNKGTVSVKANEAKTMKAKLLETGDYFVSVESTNYKTASGGDALYNVGIDTDTVFFDSADYDLVNGWAYDKKKGINADLMMTEVSTPGKTTTNVVLDSNKMTVEGFSNFVGHNDKVDYARFFMGSDGTASFKVNATGAGTFVVYQLNAAKKKLEKIDTIKVAAGQSVSGKTLDLTEGSYFILMTAKNTNAKGDVFYNVEVDTDLKGAAMASSDLSGQSSLNYGQFASASLDPVSDKRFGEFGNGLLASL